MVTSSLFLCFVLLLLMMFSSVFIRHLFCLYKTLLLSLEDVHLSKDEEQRVAEHKADDAHNNTNLHHLVLFD